MSSWLIGGALAPFFTFNLVAFVTRPISIRLTRTTRPGLLKAVVLADSDRQRVIYGVGRFLLIAGLFGGILAATWSFG
jgi:hypothetical protein